MARQTGSKLAHLDGLRGIAAFLVYYHHHQGRSHEFVNGYAITYHAFGFNNQYYFAAFPIVRWLFSGGPSAVSVFFLISGYVLSLQPLQLLHEKHNSALARRLGSAIFRRWFRLFLPVMATTLLWALSWHLFDWMPSSREPSLVQELRKWCRNFLDYSFIFKDFKNLYNEQAWSIAFELRGSLVVYAAAMAFSELGHSRRIACEGALVLYFLLLVDGPYYAHFVMGMLLCDLDSLRERREKSESVPARHSYGSVVDWIALLTGLYLGGVPFFSEDKQVLRNSTGWYLLSFLSPSNFAVYFRFWSATLIVYALPRIAVLKRVLETRFCQYLGRISFSLYLVHGPILSILGDRLYASTGRLGYQDVNVPERWLNRFPVSDRGFYGLELNFLLPQLALLPVTIIMSELCTRMIELPSLRISRWLYDSLVQQDEKYSRFILDG